MGEWVALIVVVLKVFLLLVNKMKETPAEKRREALVDLDRAMALADSKKDLRELSKWLGEKL